MKWRIRFSRQAEKFAKKHGIYEKARESVKLFIHAMITNTPPKIDVKKLKGEHAKHYRIRLGRNYRVIFKPDNESFIVHIARIDLRKKVYRKKWNIENIK